MAKEPAMESHGGDLIYDGDWRMRIMRQRSKRCEQRRRWEARRRNVSTLRHRPSGAGSSALSALWTIGYENGDRNGVGDCRRRKSAVAELVSLVLLVVKCRRRELAEEASPTTVGLGERERCVGITLSLRPKTPFLSTLRFQICFSGTLLSAFFRLFQLDSGRPWWIGGWMGRLSEFPVVWQRLGVPSESMAFHGRRLQARCFGQPFGVGFFHSKLVPWFGRSLCGDRWASSAAATSDLEGEGGLWSPVFVWAHFAVRRPNFSTVLAVGRVGDVPAGSG
ncbi:ATP-dependent zinc metalloprotease FtsH homolog [Striga asiatica]|uniref:ATP-dependent zinc metalloprotease FtsH homolog n=1 Tax=Striga asiatica TaxID=4170 RepID=A0A5A7Q586_STRAF|nr:ATP-dependent zinc metalloprotease FtsH homolog [Striga asiatica]